MNGILNLNKPPGITSHDCVARVRRAARMKRVGHAGTLDPMATGVLLICLGQATRLSDYLMGGRKVYRTEVTFGSVTDSQDSTGKVLREWDATGLTEDALRSVLPHFTGPLLQVPPMVSALHHEGKRLYELARQGVEVERAARPVNVYRLELLGFTPGDRPKAVVEVECSAGTYIRTLSHDLGEAVGCGAHMSALERRAVGAFTVGDAVEIEAVVDHSRAGTLSSLVSPMWKAVEDSPRVPVGEEELKELAHGRTLLSPEGLGEAELVSLIGPEGDLVALARGRGGRLQPFKVLLGEAR